MKTKLESMSDEALLNLADELKQSTFDNKSIVRKLITFGDTKSFPLGIIEINANLVQVLADRLYNLKGG